jgi:predicted nucleotidyltransferase
MNKWSELFSLIEQKSPGAIPLYLTVRGSNAYGTNIPTSDIDFAGVFIQSHDDILGNKYLEQINDSTNDTVIYELRRFFGIMWNK